MEQSENEHLLPLSELIPIKKVMQFRIDNFYIEKRGRHCILWPTFSSKSVHILRVTQAGQNLWYPMELAHNLTDLPPETSCQINKYQSVTDILNPLWLGIKLSFTILYSSGVSKPSSSGRNPQSAEAKGCWSNTIVLVRSRNEWLQDQTFAN